MDYQDYVKPELVENGVKYFLNETLKQCNIFKTTYNNFVFNMSLLIIFILILGLILLLKYKGKLTPLEKAEKEREKKQYILSKINKFQEAKRQAHQELITGLPNWDASY
jgi:hypothetical protein